MNLKKARDLVVEHMHYDGASRELLTSEEFWEVYCLGDGFGKCSPERLRGINGGYDWSHIRDSSPEGWVAMAERIQQVKKDRLVEKLLEQQKEKGEDWEDHLNREIAILPLFKR